MGHTAVNKAKKKPLPRQGLEETNELVRLEFVANGEAGDPGLAVFEIDSPA